MPKVGLINRLNRNLLCDTHFALDFFGTGLNLFSKIDLTSVVASEISSSSRSKNLAGLLSLAMGTRCTLGVLGDDRTGLRRSLVAAVRMEANDEAESSNGNDGRILGLDAAAGGGGTMAGGGGNCFVDHSMASSSMNSPEEWALCSSSSFFCLKAEISHFFPFFWPFFSGEPKVGKWMNEWMQVKKVRLHKR